jgi:hypothetical protein
VQAFINLVAQMSGNNGWAVVQTQGGGLKIEVATEGGRSQVVEITFGADPEGRPMAYFSSGVTTVDNVADPWYLLGLNTQMAYGAMAVRGREVVVVETQLVGSADYDELQRAIFFVGKFADDLEKQVHGANDAR